MKWSHVPSTSGCSATGAFCEWRVWALFIEKGEQHGKNSLVRNIWHSGRSGRTVCRFFSGCPMRCQYCHNPDTWKIEDGEEMTADEIIDRFERNRSFYQTGGITATGGEPDVTAWLSDGAFYEGKGKGYSHLPGYIRNYVSKENIQEQIRTVRERSASLE